MRNLYGYISVSALYLFLLWLDFEAWAMYLKPCLIPVLMYTIWYGQFHLKSYILWALVFSTIGDILLIFSSHHTLFFISGLIAFLIAHLIYIALFFKWNKLNQQAINLKSKWPLIFLISLYLISMNVYLWTGLGDLKLPVLIYSIVISIMLFMAIQVSNNLTSPKNTFLISGALLFVLSDSLLAINKFGTPLIGAAIYIMFSYLGAQGLITHAFNKES